jgi:hypothetical protein
MAYFHTSYQWKKRKRLTIRLILPQYPQHEKIGQWYNESITPIESNSIEVVFGIRYQVLA